MNDAVLFLLIIFAGISLVPFVIWIIFIVDDAFGDSDLDKEMMESWNPIKWIMYGVEKLWSIFIAAATWKPKTGIDKEIEETEKEISELEKHKKKMDKLTELKQRKEELFTEVRGTKEHSDPTKEEEMFYFGRDE